MCYPIVGKKPGLGRPGAGPFVQGWGRKHTPLRIWYAITRQFRDGHREHRWATELTLLGYGANQPVRAVCPTTGQCTLPEKTSAYLTTNLTNEQASLAQVIRLYGLRISVEESYDRMKEKLGRADFMVRSDRAIRHFRTLVCCAFAFWR